MSGLGVAPEVHSAGSGRPLLTPAGRERLRSRMEHLRSEVLPDARDRASQTRDPRDLEEIERITSELVGLTRLLDESDVIRSDPHAFDGRISPGMRALIDFGEGSRWVRPVHPAEAALDEERITVDSPLGVALLGARAGWVVWVAAPSGMRPCTVVSVDCTLD